MAIKISLDEFLRGKIKQDSRGNLSATLTMPNFYEFVKAAKSCNDPKYEVRSVTPTAHNAEVRVMTSMGLVCVKPSMQVPITSSTVQGAVNNLATAHTIETLKKIAQNEDVGKNVIEDQDEFMAYLNQKVEL